MEELESNVGICESCKASKPAFDLVSRELWRPAVADLIAHDHPEWKSDAKICLSCLHRYRIKAIERALQDERGELSAVEKDYGVNLEAEVEVRQLHLKLDQLMSHQWQRLLEIQQLQTDMLEEISERDHLA